MKTATGFGKNRPNSPPLIQEGMRNEFVQTISSQKVNYGQYLTAGHHSRESLYLIPCILSREKTPEEKTVGPTPSGSRARRFIVHPRAAFHHLKIGSRRRASNIFYRSGPSDLLDYPTEFGRLIFFRRFRDFQEEGHVPRLLCESCGRYLQKRPLPRPKKGVC